MSLSVENAILEVLQIVRPIAATHPFWHLNHSQDEMLKRIDDLIQALENPESTVPVAPVDVTKADKNNG